MVVRKRRGECELVMRSWREQDVKIIVLVLEERVRMRNRDGSKRELGGSF